MLNGGGEMPQISVIVPVYNAEKFLKRCVDSILSQTFSDFELLLIDDGSIDQSALICDEYARSDTRIQVVHKENGGAAAARNAGIRMANGAYLAFCDSDDMVSPQWLQHMIDSADSGTLPIGASCHKLEVLGKAKDIQIEPGKEYPREEYFCFQKRGLAGFLWNALYSREIVVENDLLLREQRDCGDYNEDLIFTLGYVHHVDRILYTGYADYLYAVHDDSLSRGNDRFYYEKYAEKYRLWKSFLDENCSGDSGKLSQLATGMLYHFLLSLRKNAHDLRKIREIVRSYELQDILTHADTRKENPKEVYLIRKKLSLLLYLFYKAVQLKGRLS